MNKTEFFPGSLKSHTWTDGRYEGHTDQGNILRVEPITDYIIRVRYSSRGYFEKDFSYAIDPAFDRSPTDISYKDCLLYTSPSPRDATLSRMPSSA